MKESNTTTTTPVKHQESSSISPELAALLHDKIRAMNNVTSGQSLSSTVFVPITTATIQQNPPTVAALEQTQPHFTKRLIFPEKIDFLPRKKSSVFNSADFAQKNNTPETPQHQLIPQIKSDALSAPLADQQNSALPSNFEPAPTLLIASSCIPVNTSTIDAEQKAILEKILKHKNYDTGRPILEKDLCRFQNLTTYKDDKFSFSANTIPDMPFHISEGPYTHNEVIRFFKNVLFNTSLDKTPVEYILAAGSPYEGNKFYNYFNLANPVMLEEFDEQKENFEEEFGYSEFNNEYGDDNASEENDLSTLHLKMTEKNEMPGGNLIIHKISVKLDNKETEVKVLNLPNFNEFSTTPLSENDIKELLNVYQRCKENGTSFIIHCAAGRGRSGILALAFIIFEHYEECYELNGTPKYNTIAKKLWALRDTRPGTIQRTEQLQMAIDLGQNLKKVYNLDLEAQQIKSNNSSNTDVRP